MRQILLLVLSLGGMLAVAVWWTWVHWFAYDDSGMSVHGYVALLIGVVATFVVGAGLMALVFYSSRHGYDEDVGTGD